jgi:L-lactate dehydrogenase complex protein LldE
MREKPSSQQDVWQSTREDTRQDTQQRITVALFATCINDVMYPQTCEATVKLLERLGCTVAFPVEQSCCGQIFTNTGYHAEALGAVRAYVAAFAGFDYIVGPSGSCVASVRDQHPLLAAETGDAAFLRAVNDVVAKTYELTEFLLDVLGVEDVGASFPHTVTFHPTCHAVRLAKIGDRPYRLLSHVRGLTLLPLGESDQCCGFGGTFSVKNDLLSAAMVADKAAEVMRTGAEYLVNVDNACLMNIGGRLRREGSAVKSIHLAEILACTGDEDGGVAGGRDAAGDASGDASAEGRGAR